jgi:hypothetical protein
LICRREHIAGAVERLDGAESKRPSAAVGGRSRYSDVRGKNSVIRMDTDEINQSHELLATTNNSKTHPSPEKRGSQQPSTRPTRAAEARSNEVADRAY